MTKTTLGLLRHGQTDWNIDLRLQGTADIPMNQTGVSQVERAADVLAQQGWDLVISSPLGRAKHTAEIVAHRLGIQEISTSELLLERSFGIGEGLTYAEWSEKYSKLDVIPGAESTEDVIRRSRLLLSDVEQRFAGARVLAVSHGALIRFVLSEVTNGLVPPAGERLQNASLHRLFHQGSWSLESWTPEPLGAQLPDQAQ